MKILLIVAVVVVLFILGVVLTGSLLPKRHMVSRSASYRATPERLFSFIAGDQKWRPELLRSELVADVSGRELIRETTRNGKTITYETLESTPPLSLKRRIATENLPYSGSWTYLLAPDGEATVVRITEDGEVYNPVFRFVSRFVIGHTRSIDNYLRALGKAVGQDVQITD